MTNHTGTMGLCQPHAHNSRQDRIPPPSSPSPDSIDRRLVQRYGILLLTGGYTALPTYAWMYYARLGVSEAEMVLIAQLCTYWWSARDPYPGEAALAARMGKSVRTIQGYLRSLEGKGLLHIQTRLSTHGRQSTNAYDLRPFFAAVEGLARLDGLLPADDAPPARSSPAVVPHGEQRPLCAEQPAEAERGERSRVGGVKNLSPQVNPVEIDSFDSDSMPPTPTNAKPGTARVHTTTSGRDERPQLPGAAAPSVSHDADGSTLAAEIAALGAELGDDAPTSSVTRAGNLQRDAGMSLDRFLRLLDEAAARTRDRQESIVKRRRDGQAPNGMPYLFAVLQDLAHPAPPRMADVGPDRRRAGPSGRRRHRRDGGRGEASGSYAAWSDSPVPLPITEEHPVWRAVLDELAQVMTPENFNAWLASTRALGQDGDVLRVAVPAAFNKTWLEHKLAGKVAGALHTIDYAALRVEPIVRVAYVVEPAA